MAQKDYAIQQDELAKMRGDEVINRNVNIVNRLFEGCPKEEQNVKARKLTYQAFMAKKTEAE